MENPKSLMLELNIDDGEYRFPSTISSVIIDADSELKELEEQIEETTETVKALTPECDKKNYCLQPVVVK